MREQRVVLKHHAESALFRPQRVDARIVEQDLSAGDRQQPGDAVERRRLAAAGRSEQGDELAPLDHQIQTPEGVEGAEVALHAIQGEGLKNFAHDLSYLVLLAPICSSHRRKACTSFSRR